MCEKGCRQVRRVKETAHEVNKAELQLYADQLRADLEEAKKPELVPIWDDEYRRSSTGKDDRDVEQDLTRIATDNEREEGVRNSGSMCIQNGVNRGDSGEEGGVGASEDDQEHHDHDEGVEDNE